MLLPTILGNGSVVTWGHSRHGGDSRKVQPELNDVVCIQSSGYAFAAIRRHGSVVTWGHSGCGGDSRDVQDQLQDVQLLRSLATDL